MKATRRRSRDAAGAVPELGRRVYAVVGRIPRGRVATYGQVAELAGRPRAARAVGAALRATPPTLDLPWHRVLGAAGPGLARVSLHDPIGGAMQRAMLEAEGVAFSAGGRVALADHGWQGPAAPGRRKPLAAARRPPPRSSRR